MKSVLLPLIFNTLLILNLSATQTDNDGEVIKHDDKNQFIFSHWKNLDKINTEALPSADHNAWFDIYVSTEAKKAYIEKLSLLPVGSIIVKPLYPDEQRSETSKLTIMLKMEKGYDRENGDWWYGVYDESGIKGSSQGKIKSCIECHTQAKKTDYMFSESVIESMNEED
jgi:hypothetical protein